MNSPTILQMATTVDEMVADTADTPFDLNAHIYGCDADGAYLLGVGEDVYALLRKTRKPDGLLAVSIVVTGWASPNDGTDDTLPSKHPERVRVRVVACKGIDGFVTRINFAHKPNEPEVIDEQGQGAMVEAINEWWGE